jgi:glutamine amidotransferase
MTVAVVDYGAGNLSSVIRVLDRMGAEPVVASTPELVLSAERIVLPGVGAAGEAVRRLRESGLADALDEAVRRRGRPLLGICLGMQLLAERLLEFGEWQGLGWLKGEVRHIGDIAAGRKLRIPHMGWNRAQATGEGKRGWGGNALVGDFYFAHSFTLIPEDDSVVATRTDYGVSLVSAVQFDTVVATQFHPEKSQVRGEKLVDAFLQWRP